MENTITNLLDAIIPELQSLMGQVKLWMILALLAGPVLALALGAFYRFLSPKQANHHLGYRTYFGMGSVEAWRYTQQLAGKVWCIAGCALLAVGVIGAIVIAVQDPSNTAVAGLVFAVIEALVALGALGFIEVTVAKKYDEKGKPRAK